MRKLLHRLWRVAHETVFPGRCLVCGSFFTRPRPDGTMKMPGTAGLGAELCTACLKQVLAIQPPVCSACGMPFAARQGSDHLCARCIRSPRAFTRARCALVYDRAVIPAVHAFKYAGRVRMAAPLGAMMLAVFRSQWEPGSIDLVLPVPLHPKRMRSRGFNQAYLLVRSWGLPENCPKPPSSQPVLKRELIIRRRHTASQSTLDRRRRTKNIRGAFALTDRSQIQGRSILLIDDVYTTGATVDECARLLLEGGARQVDVLTLARAVLHA